MTEPSPELRDRVLADYVNAYQQHPDPGALYGHRDGRLAHYSPRRRSDVNPWVTYECLPFTYGATGRCGELPDGFVELVPITAVRAADQTRDYAIAGLEAANERARVAEAELAEMRTRAEAAEHDLAEERGQLP